MTGSVGSNRYNLLNLTVTQERVSYDTTWISFKKKKKDLELLFINIITLTYHKNSWIVIYCHLSLPSWPMEILV